jgi:hypothetical protein
MWGKCNPEVQRPGVGKGWELGWGGAIKEEQVIWLS